MGPYFVRWLERRRGGAFSQVERVFGQQALDRHSDQIDPEIRRPQSKTAVYPVRHPSRLRR